MSSLQMYLWAIDQYWPKITVAQTKGTYKSAVPNLNLALKTAWKPLSLNGFPPSTHDRKSFTRIYGRSALRKMRVRKAE